MVQLDLNYPLCKIPNFQVTHTIIFVHKKEWKMIIKNDKKNRKVLSFC